MPTAVSTCDDCLRGDAALRDTPAAASSCTCPDRRRGVPVDGAGMRDMSRAFSACAAGLGGVPVGDTELRGTPASEDCLHGLSTLASFST